jgi:hypothetical protein
MSAENGERVAVWTVAAVVGGAAPQAVVAGMAVLFFAAARRGLRKVR